VCFGTKDVWDFEEDRGLGTRSLRTERPPQAAKHPTENPVRREGATGAYIEIMHVLLGVRDWNIEIHTPWSANWQLSAGKPRRSRIS
jgi:hypothetical protein